MPLTFTIFIARFPAGLFVYWITSNTFTLVQNFLIYRRLGQTPQKLEAEPAKPTEEPVSSPAKQTPKSRRRKKKKKK